MDRHSRISNLDNWPEIKSFVDNRARGQYFTFLGNCPDPLPLFSSSCLFRVQLRTGLPTAITPPRPHTPPPPFVRQQNARAEIIDTNHMTASQHKRKAPPLGSVPGPVTVRYLSCDNTDFLFFV